MSRRFSVVGLNYRTAPLALRGAFAFEGESLRQALRFLKGRGIEEGLVLSTCNRIEVYAFAETDTPLLDLYHARQHSLGSAFYQSVYRKEGDEAVRHLFRVAAGLDSKILGENEIQGQLRRAWSYSKEEGMVNAPLQMVIEQAIRAGKRVRTETELGRNALSMASIAVRKGLSLAGSFEAKTVAVLGTGEIAQRVLRELRDVACGERLIFSRSRSRAELLCQEFGASPRSIEELEGELPKIDVLLSATHSEIEIIRTDMLLGRTRPLTLIDLAVPATIAKDVGQMAGIDLANVDDLSITLSENQQLREQAVPTAEAVIAQELRSYFNRLREAEVVPLMAALHQNSQEICKEQVAWAIDKLGPLNEAEQRVIETLAHRIMNRLLHHPLKEIKGLADDPAGLDVARRLLGLSELDKEGERVA